MSRLEIDRGFNSKPVKELYKGNVIKMVRDAVALDSHLASGKRFNGLVGF
jgi:hypothetical protein